MNLFCYGTLMHPQIIDAVVGRLPQSKPTSLKGYQIYSLTSAPYPAIIKCDNATVEGVIYLDLSETEIHLLDRYEGNEYQREQSELVGGNGFWSACFYVYKPQYKSHLASRGWDYAHFVQQHLSHYLQRLRQ